MNKEAQDLFSRIFVNLNTRWHQIVTFRKVVDLGLPDAGRQLTAENRDWWGYLSTDPEYDRYFTDKTQFLRMKGGPEQIGQEITTGQLRAAQRSVDAASLVFTHSALDAAIYDLCRVCALLAPGDWERFLLKKKVTLESLKKL